MKNRRTYWNEELGSYLPLRDKDKNLGWDEINELGIREDEEYDKRTDNITKLCRPYGKRNYRNDRKNF